MMAAKVFMDVQYVNKAYASDKIYFNRNIFSFGKEVYVDCGGYNGDTAIEFTEENPQVEKIYIFEGIKSLADKCLERFKGTIYENRVKVYPKAVTDRIGEVHFSLGEGTGDSRIDSNGDIIVQTTTLDICIEDKVTFIKMDIEGSEKEAIEGAKDIILKYTPKMAICIYHLKDDFWRIPELILSINPNYHFMVRQHDPVALSETVLYCIPNDMIEASKGYFVKLYCKNLLTFYVI